MKYNSVLTSRNQHYNRILCCILFWRALAANIRCNTIVSIHQYKVPIQDATLYLNSLYTCCTIHLFLAIFFFGAIQRKSLTQLHWPKSIKIRMAGLATLDKLKLYYRKQGCFIIKWICFMKRKTKKNKETTKLLHGLYSCIQARPINGQHGIWVQLLVLLFFVSLKNAI